jgi:hypothetical protein
MSPRAMEGTLRRTGRARRLPGGAAAALRPRPGRPSGAVRRRPALALRRPCPPSAPCSATLRQGPPRPRHRHGGFSTTPSATAVSCRRRRGQEPAAGQGRQPQLEAGRSGRSGRRRPRAVACSQKRGKPASDICNVFQARNTSSRFGPGGPLNRCAAGSLDRWIAGSLDRSTPPFDLWLPTAISGAAGTWSPR